MVEDVGLDAFVLLPDLVAREEIDLNGDAVSGRFLLSDNQVHLLIHDRKAAQIAFDVDAVELCIGGDRKSVVEGKSVCGGGGRVVG